MVLKNDIHKYAGQDASEEKQTNKKNKRNIVIFINNCATLI